MTTPIATIIGFIMLRAASDGEVRVPRWELVDRDEHDLWQILACLARAGIVLAGVAGELSECEFVFTSQLTSEMVESIRAKTAEVLIASGDDSLTYPFEEWAGDKASN